MVTMAVFYNFELQFVLLIKTIKNNVQTNLKNDTTKMAILSQNMYDY